MPSNGQLIEREKRSSDHELASYVLFHMSSVLSHMNGCYSTPDHLIRKEYEIISQRFSGRMSLEAEMACDYIAAGIHINRNQAQAVLDTFESLVPRLEKSEPETNIYPASKR